MEYLNKGRRMQKVHHYITVSGVVDYAEVTKEFKGI